MVNLFHSESMQHVSFLLRFDDAPLVSVVLAHSACFDPYLAAVKDKKLPDKQGNAYRRIFSQALSDWQKTAEFLSIELPLSVDKINAIKKCELVEIENRLAEIWKVCTQHKEKQRLLNKKLDAIKHLLKLLDRFSNLDVDLSLLKQDFEFLDVRLGIVPQTYVSRLKQALGIEGYYLSIYLQEGDNAHVIVAGVKELEDSVHAVLDSASFQPLQIPEEFHEHPKSVYAKLVAKQDILLAQEEQLQQDYTALKHNFAQDVVRLGKLLTLAKPYAVLSREMLRKGQLTEIMGWVPTAKIETIQTQLSQYVKNPVVLETRHPKVQEYAKTPSYLLRPKWLEPFICLVKNYGVPGYREFEPSWFFTLSYILMFGIMFGDVGHGSAIIALAWLIRKKWPVFFPFFIAIGLSSILFGFIYGSVFAYEHVLSAFWMKPMDDPLLMLSLALIWGISFIIFLNIVSIYNRLISMKYNDALFHPGGMTGLLLYIALLWGGFETSRGQFSEWNLVFIVAPLLLVFIYYWNKVKSPVMERILVSLIETYDAIISFFSNTISFLRIAAFTLNHSALAIALSTLAAMNDGVAHWSTVILVNFFIGINFC